MQRNSWLILGALCLCASPAAAQVVHCDDLQADKPGDAARAFECLEIAHSDLITLWGRIDALEARMGDLLEARKGDLASLAARIDALETSAQSVVAVPALGDHPDTRAVVAYVSAKGEKTCPKGWEPFEAAKDRFILGAGAAYPVVGTLGGEAEVSLTEAQLAPHDHRSELQYGWDVNGNGGKERIDVGDGSPWGGRTGYIQTNDAGGGEPHNNMPPFIALYFCQPSG